MVFLTYVLVCAIEQDYNQADGSNTIKRVIPIAGEYTSSHGRPLDPILTRLKGSGSHSDSKKEGVRVELNGGRYPFDKSSGREQRAIIEFECDPDRTGLEGDERDEREKVDDEVTEKRNIARAEGDEKDGEGDKDGKDGKDDKDGKDGKDGESEPVEDNSSLKLIGYQLEVGEGNSRIDVLRLNWRTKYACEGKRDSNAPSKSSSHWGFFTWFLIMYVDHSYAMPAPILLTLYSVFMSVAAYLIFGSWLNYNRYGARGWDLVPHGDSIRDLPYTVKDWGKSLVSSVQGGGSRGGYSAV